MPSFYDPLQAGVFVALLSSAFILIAIWLRRRSLAARANSYFASYLWDRMTFLAGMVAVLLAAYPILLTFSDSSDTRKWATWGGTLLGFAIGAAVIQLIRWRWPAQPTPAPRARGRRWPPQRPTSRRRA